MLAVETEVILHVVITAGVSELVVTGKEVILGVLMILAAALDEVVIVILRGEETDVRVVRLAVTTGAAEPVRPPVRVLPGRKNSVAPYSDFVTISLSIGREEKLDSLCMCRLQGSILDEILPQ